MAKKPMTATKILKDMREANLRWSQIEQRYAEELVRPLIKRMMEIINKEKLDG